MMESSGIADAGVPSSGALIGRDAVAPYATAEPGAGRGARLGRGVFVVVVGPDGAGKTSVARALIAQHDGPTAYFHFLPPILGSLVTRPPDAAAPPPDKGGRSGSRLLGCVRLVRSALRARLAHATRVRPALGRGTLVVGDRWIYGYLAQPAALRFHGPAWLAAMVIRLLPRPDLVVNLGATPDVIWGRKQELTLSEIGHELDAWSRLPEPRAMTFSASDPPDVIARRIFEALDS